MNANAESLFEAKPPALREVSPFPPIAARLLRLVSEEYDNVEFREVANLVRSDASFSAEVLRLANSPLFSRREIKNVPHALAVLGLSQLRAIVTTLAVREVVLQGPQTAAVRISWRHTLATALISETLGTAFWVDKGLAYTAGLLHDIGLLALATHSEGLSHLVAIPSESIHAFLAKEREVAGIQHTEAGSSLLADWGLPREFAEVAGNHHLPPDEQTSDVSTVVHLSCLAASMAGFPTCNTSSEWDPERIVAWLPEKSRPVYRSKLDNLPMMIAANVNLFECDFLQAAAS